MQEQSEVSKQPEACLVWRSLDSLTEQDIASLVYFAERRLERVGLNPQIAQDTVQDALQAVLIGRQATSTGRHPRMVDYADPAAFRSYLGGVINSLVTVERRKRIHSSTHISIGVPESDSEVAPANDLPSPERTESTVNWSDLQDVFFQRLRARAPASLHPFLADWEAGWCWRDQIPVAIPQRRFRRAIKVLAREVLSELDEKLAA